jgi:hypothetical protein
MNIRNQILEDAAIMKEMFKKAQTGKSQNITDFICGQIDSDAKMFANAFEPDEVAVNESDLLELLSVAQANPVDDAHQITIMKIRAGLQRPTLNPSQR